MGPTPSLPDQDGINRIATIPTEAYERRCRQGHPFDVDRTVQVQERYGSASVNLHCPQCQEVSAHCWVLESDKLMAIFGRLYASSFSSSRLFRQVLNRLLFVSSMLALLSLAQLVTGYDPFASMLEWAFALSLPALHHLTYLLFFVTLAMCLVAIVADWVRRII